MKVKNKVGRPKKYTSGTDLAQITRLVPKVSIPIIDDLISELKKQFLKQTKN